LKTRWTIRIICVLVLGLFLYGVNAQQSPQSKFEVLKDLYFQFDKLWLPDVKSELIGLNGYKTQTNLRPVEKGEEGNNKTVEGVNGYSKINTTINDIDYYRSRSGIHFKKDYPQESHVLTQYYNYDGTLSQVWDNQTSIPNQGSATLIHTDASSGTFTGTYSHNTQFTDISGVTAGGVIHKSKFASVSGVTTGGVTHKTQFASISTTAVLTYTTPRSRFANAPGGHIIYSNAVESQIWGGNESRVGVFVLSGANVTEYVTNPQDYTDQINNEYSTSLERVTIDASGGTAYFLVGATRKLSGVSFYVQSANATAGAFVKFSEWRGTSGTTWVELAETDGTSGLANNGQVSFASTVDTSKQKYLEGDVLYYYLGQLSAGSAVVYYMTLNVPWQDLNDLWDTVNRTALVVQISRNGDYKDATDEVAESSSALFPIGADVGGLTSNDHIIVGFEDRIQAIYFEMLSGNTNPFGPDTTISTWDGDSWEASGVTYDHTGDGDSGHTGVTPLGKSGALTWQPPAHEDEFKQYLFGKTGYFYKIEYDGTLGGTAPPDSAVIIDQIFGITAPYKLYNFKFPAYHQNRVFLFGYLKGNEAHRVDVSQTNSPDVWNGRDSSDNMRQSIWVNGGGEITAAKSISNRFGNRIYNMLAVFKKNELYTIIGTTPDISSPNRYEVNEVSTDLGCPAPFTLTSIEIGFVMSQGQPERNILAWLSATGPYLFDGSFPRPLRGIDSYFTPNHDNYVGASDIEDAFAWYESNYTEWNLRVGDYHFVYNFTFDKWYLKDTGTAEKIMVAIPVTDTKGNKYTYGGIDTGYLMRLENGNAWDGTAITQTIETGDFYAGNDAWSETILRRVKLANRVISESATVQVDYYKDTATSGTSIMSMNLSEGSLTSRRQTHDMNRIAYWHRVKFSVDTSSTNKGWQPLGFGLQQAFSRKDNR